MHSRLARDNCGPSPRTAARTHGSSGYSMDSVLGFGFGFESRCFDWEGVTKDGEES